MYVRKEKDATGPINEIHMNRFLKYHKEKIQEINEHSVEIDALLILFCGHGTNENKKTHFHPKT